MARKVTKPQVEPKFDEATVKGLYGCFKAEELKELIGILTDVMSEKVARRQRRKAGKA